MVEGTSVVGRARGLLDRPLGFVTILGCAFVAGQWWWISNARFFGALDTDEGGAITTSLQFHRALARGPMDLYHAVFGTGSGPLVPLLSLPFVAVGGRSATSPILVQPVLVLISAVGAAGAVRHLAGRRPAVLAGCCTLAMPALITSSRTDQYSNGAGAAMCLAVWALVASNRLRRPWPVLLFGVACGAMTITRTMAVSFLPAMAAAALVAADLRQRKVWRNLVLGMVAAMLVAVPWWYAQWDYVSSYLRSSGYGSRSFFFGEATVTGRIFDHFGYLLRDFRAFLPLGAFIAVVAGVQAVSGLRGSGRAWLDRNRDLLAVWVVVLLGSLALLSSSNRGYWFSTPLDSVLVIAVVAAGARLLRRDAAPRVWVVAAAALVASVTTAAGWAMTGIGMTIGLGVLAGGVAIVVATPRKAIAMAALVLGVGAAVMVASMPLVGPSAEFADASPRAQLAGGLEPYMPTVHEADARLSSPSIATRRRVAAEWAAAATELDRRLLELEDTMSIGGSGTLAEVVTGQRGLFETNTVAVARELGPRGVRWQVSPNTFETSDAQILRDLTPTAEEGTPRLLIVIEGRASPFPDALGWHRLVRLAEREGWEILSTIALPDRGRVVIYAHPDNTAAD